MSARAKRKPHIPMKESREDRAARERHGERGIDRPWSRRDNAWFREEAQPCGEAGKLSFHYSVCMGRGKTVPDLSDFLVARPRPWRLVIWEPLLTKAPKPPKAQAFCCYSQTIIFYHAPYIVSPWRKIFFYGPGRPAANASPGHFEEWEMIETRLNSHHDRMIFEGEIFDITSARALWKKGRWWMRYGARRAREQETVGR